MMTTKINLDYISNLYFQFDGRINRMTFILGFSVWSVFLMISRTFFINFASGTALVPGIISISLLLFVGLTTGLAIFALLIKRLNDIGHSGWWSLLIGVPVANFFLLLILIFMRGQSD
jgi:uncharacterized membrane protein YhaH (DUF805 family)